LINSNWGRLTLEIKRLVQEEKKNVHLNIFFEKFFCL
jgi:hypothetical protein